ncbi:relaxase/mobilization nuclease domain-containing protein [Flavobacterium sp. LAR06]|uniref:relaxase/mobilization nuclease domain-containing protein n=1 Tax=Flavobacterium sp. LAR06 TaxID=3064897 RepID=UPI0035C019D9
MVAIIKTSASILKTIAYNENKVKTGAAELIFAGNYPVDMHKISDEIKVKRFTKRTELNKNAKRNTLHISLNFSSLEHHSKEKLARIAYFYMQTIGFAKQPYLVYEHFDTGHQHLHVVTVNIEQSGRRLPLDNVLFQKSRPVTTEIEKRFGLVKAFGQRKYPKLDVSSVVGKIHYGEMESTKAITQVLDFILKRYRYTNLGELNAVLGQYNLLADRCKENSRTFLWGGLLYRILDPQGKPIGMPIKASSLDSRPTLKFLETQFKINASGNTPQKTQIKNIIERSLQRHPGVSADIFFKILQRKAITAITNKNDLGSDQLTYIDHKTKCVFSAENLGISCSLSALKNNESLQTPALKKRFMRKNNLPKL